MKTQDASTVKLQLLVNQLKTLKAWTELRRQLQAQEQPINAREFWLRVNGVGENTIND